jgi:D-alanine-D-alanine ligase
LKKLKHKKINIALLFGGRSAEHEVSLISATAIYKNLNKKKFAITSIYINKRGAWKIVESPLLAASTLNKGDFFSFLPWSKNVSSLTLDADIYFPVLHGPYGEDGTIQGLFEMADVPFVGAAVMDSAIGMDKAMTKIILKAKNLPVVKHIILQDQEWVKQKEAILSKIKEEFPIPFFVKPACLGSSVGISKVKEYGETSAALDEAFRYDQRILVEEGIKGQELECSVLGNDSPRASLPGEIIPYREFYDYRDKYIDGKTRFVIPAELTSSQIEEVQHLSLEVYKAVSCSGMARVDFFMEEKTEKIFVSELNTIPGFTEISMYPKLWEVSGLPFPQLLEQLIELGLERHKKKKRRKENFIP